MEFDFCFFFVLFTQKYTSGRLARKHAKECPCPVVSIEQYYSIKQPTETGTGCWFWETLFDALGSTILFVFVLRARHQTDR